ncbi:hypothetical protein [Amycolatopsis circi]|uniref:hypothetical protein n=1 Tax=Amycolatopsis circi TaxID=871959 RepID=UPI000E2638B8|nr:hypothetical protein [Amycolatopsis circi]
MSAEEIALRVAEEQSHYEKSQDWLERAESAYEQFDADQDPRDVSLLRKAEVAIGLSRAHAALAGLWPPAKVILGAQSPVPSAAEDHTGVRH